MWAVVQRELKSESRNPFTYWLRIISAGALLAFMAVVNVSRFPFAGRPAGPHLNPALDLFTALVQITAGGVCFSLLKTNLLHRHFALEKTGAN